MYPSSQVEQLIIAKLAEDLAAETSLLDFGEAPAEISSNNNQRENSVTDVVHTQRQNITIKPALTRDDTFLKLKPYTQKLFLELRFW